jgi:hypothetical protein
MPTSFASAAVTLGTGWHVREGDAAIIPRWAVPRAPIADRRRDTPAGGADVNREPNP